MHPNEGTDPYSVTGAGVPRVGGPCKCPAAANAPCKWTWVVWGVRHQTGRGIATADKQIYNEGIPHSMKPARHEVNLLASSG